MKNSNQLAYWNSVSSNKEFTTTLDPQIISRYVAKDAVILDFGCGYGRTLNELKQLGYTHLVGFDFAPKMINRGLCSFPYLDLRVCSENKLKVPSESVDLVLLFAVLTCLQKDEEQISILSEIKRILKPGGVVYINDFLINNDERNQNRYHKYAKKYNNFGIFELKEGAILRHHSEEWIKELTDDFKLKEFEKLTFKTMNGHTSNGFYLIGEK